MGFEVTYTCHPRKEEGAGYDTEKKEEKIIKVGKPFEDIPLENLAASIMSQLARRDVWVVDVKVVELARRDIAFKECKDGQGIMLRNRRFSFNESAQMVAEDVVEAPPVCGLQPHEMARQPHEAVVPSGVQPHERVQQNIDDLYANPNKAVPVKRTNSSMPPVNQKKVLYKVIFDPLQWEQEARNMKLKFTQDREYPVHQIIPHPLGRLDLQNIVVTDDTGKAVKIDEKYFTTIGKGLFADDQLNFSGSGQNSQRSGARKPKLAFENEMFMDAPPQDRRGSGRIMEGVPVDDGSIPDEVLRMPDIRPGRN